LRHSKFGPVEATADASSTAFLGGYDTRAGTTVTVTSLFTLKSDPMGSQEASRNFSESSVPESVQVRARAALDSG
jgi:hypothetical protein